MAEAPWITIVGLGEDGPEGLAAASRKALADAEIVMGPKRHLCLLPDLVAETVEWPVPFSEGLETLRGFEGRRVVILASGDPFWYGAGTVIARAFASEEWRAIPGPSTFALAASRLGWALEETVCLGLHAAPLTRLRPRLAVGLRCLVLLRDGAAVEALGSYLTEHGFGASRLHVMEALGGPRERVTTLLADAVQGKFHHPVCVGLSIRGSGTVLPRASGLPDAVFDTDGVMTKRPVRALTISTLAPRPGELLWDIGGGSGTIAVEWLLSDPSCEAVTIEPRADRIALIRKNAETLGVDRLRIVEGKAPDVLAGLPMPAAVFVGGGLSTDLMERLETLLPAGTRLVANAVTFEAEALLLEWYSKRGGELLRLDLSQAGPLGAKTAWKSAYPLVQWSAVL